MSDLISRQAAIDELMVRDKELRNINWYDKPYAEGECRGIDEALAIVSNLPSAQSQRKKGKWIDNETSYADGVRQTCTCSICGQRSVRPLGRFCRWCGADMREEDE